MSLACAVFGSGTLSKSFYFLYISWMDLAFGLHVHAQRPSMISSARYPTISRYRVEVSGWDKHQTFFVEKSELEWNEESGKQVALSHKVPDGAVVFLRLLQPMSTNRSLPVAYEAEFLSVSPNGQHQFRLHPACPRMDQGSATIN
jgi:hypothetical protein